MIWFQNPKPESTNYTRFDWRSYLGLKGSPHGWSRPLLPHRCPYGRQLGLPRSYLKEDTGHTLAVRSTPLQPASVFCLKWGNLQWHIWAVAASVAVERHSRQRNFCRTKGAFLCEIIDQWFVGHSSCSVLKHELAPLYISLKQLGAHRMHCTAGGAPAAGRREGQMAPRGTGPKTESSVCESF